LVKKALRRPQNTPNCTIYFKIFRGGMPPDPPRLFWIHILYRLATRLIHSIIILFFLLYSYLLYPKNWSFSETRWSCLLSTAVQVSTPALSFSLSSDLWRTRNKQTWPMWLPMVCLGLTFVIIWMLGFTNKVLFLFLYLVNK